MTFLRRLHGCGRVGAAAVLLVRVAAYAQASPDEPAAVLVYPYVVVDPATAADTLIQLTNTSDQLVELRCFYEDFTPECSSGQPSESCFPGAVTCAGVCVPNRTVLPLRLRVTPRQPLAWHASTGLQELPLDGVEHMGALGANNQFSNVPGLGMRPFVGTLRCVAMTSDPYRPLQDNVLVGQATIELDGPHPGTRHHERSAHRGARVASQSERARPRAVGRDQRARPERTAGRRRVNLSPAALHRRLQLRWRRDG